MIHLLKKFANLIEVLSTMGTEFRVLQVHLGYTNILENSVLYSSQKFGVPRNQNQLAVFRQ